MKHLDSVRANLNKKLASHLTEADRIRKILRVLVTLTDDEPTPTPRRNKKDWRSGKRVRHVRYKVTCLRCKRVYKAKRNPNGKNLHRIPRFCHKPCTSGMWAREQRLAAEKSSPTKPKPTVLVKGDPLTASH